ncbi:MAG: CehA/McbA family metallohydrolase [Planctomycetaceae bacterium]|nr:CehA/McbA family metallohydrolase [Planctomycetaceae bacterium]
MRDSWDFRCVLGLLLAVTVTCLPANAHDQTRKLFLKSQQRRQARAHLLENARTVADSCQLQLEIVDAATGRPLAGLVRLTDLGRKQAIHLPELIQRENDWYAADAKSSIKVPRTRLKLEVIHGITSLPFEQVLELQELDQTAVKVSLQRFDDPSQRGLVAGNTHLHLMRLTHAEAYRYLRIVPNADNLDLVFLSHLRRIPDERDYISNLFTGADLQRLSQHGVLFGNGEEHRHNFGRGGEGYGHVMLLDLVKLIRPVSIGPGIMGTGTDGLPLRRGIREAHQDGATAIWCHNSFGFEDIPSWMSGVLDAQNIFDGGSHGTYDETFYRYLNLGLRVPFSTGTDWFIDDFNRAYVSVKGKLTAKKWLQALSQGRSFITNGPLLELRVGESKVGDTIKRTTPGTLEIVGNARGRVDFGQLELIHNGKVIHGFKATRREGHYQAEFKLPVEITESGWLALRVSGAAAMNAFGKKPFAHTSPIYVEMPGQSIFQPAIAWQLIKEMQQSVETIDSKGTFANDQERSRVLQVYQDGIQILQRRLQKQAAGSR